MTISNLRIVRIPAGGGNGAADIAILGGHDTTIANDYLGILPGATCPASNQNQGINISTFTTGASGSGAGAAYIYGNVISCHAADGVINGGTYVYLGEDRSGNVSANYIGTTGDSTHAAGNAGNGVYSVGNNLTIRSNVIAFNGVGGIVDSGSGSTIELNLISGNGATGLLLDGGNDKQIIANDIGTTSDGLGAVPNGADGIWITGGTGSLLTGNLVAHNSGNGITVTGSTTHALIQDVNVFANGGLPIDLGNDGATANGTKFAPGPNSWLPYPIITSSSGNVILGFTCPNCHVYIFHAFRDPASAGGGVLVLLMVNGRSSEVAEYVPPSM